MQVFQIVVHPVLGSTNGSFDAFLGTRRLCRSPTPFLAAARTLAAELVPQGAILEMWHPEATAWAMRAPVWQAAKLRVVDGSNGRPRFRKWTPDPRWSRIA